MILLGLVFIIIGLCIGFLMALGIILTEILSFGVEFLKSKLIVKARKI